MSNNLIDMVKAFLRGIGSVLSIGPTQPQSIQSVLVPVGVMEIITPLAATPKVGPRER